jgi:NitT/TauT family transport system substrate-binding protein
VVLMLAMLLAAAGCGPKQSALPIANQQPADNAQAADGSSPAAPVDVRVASLKGPTSIGLAQLITDAQADGGAQGVAQADGQAGSQGDAQADGGLHNNYDFKIVGTADEIVPGIISGDIDIALVPANLAAVLYSRTNGQVVALNINTLGVLYVVSADRGVSSLEDLRGRTVYMTGKGTTPEYAMSYLLAANGLSGQVNLEFKSEATELAALIASDPTAIAVLPEPYASSVCIKNPDLAARISLTEAWEAADPSGGSKLVTGVTVVRRAFLEANPEAVAEFCERQASSIAKANQDPAATAQLVVGIGIIDNPQIAEQAIPRCNLAYHDGKELESSLSGYLAVLYGFDPAAVGGALPGEDFYYKK